MNRRDFLRGQLQVAPSEAVEGQLAMPPMPPPPNTIVRSTATLAKYTGPFGNDHAAHLLRRTLFGVRPDEITQAVKDGMDATVAKLLTTKKAPLAPLNVEALQDVAWTVMGKRNEYVIERTNTLKAWWVGLMMKQGISLTEKMTLLLSNILVTTTMKLQDPRYTYQYLQLLRKYSMGNYKQLIQEISISAPMLEYLSGNQNQKGSPNEDFARELMELFTLGRVDRYGNHNYTENDVIEAARALTGWYTTPENTGLNKLLNKTGWVAFNVNNHDSGKKKFSSKFGNAIIQQTNSADYQKETTDLINMIFARKEVALNICREIYRWFVYYEITDFVEDTVITPMANIFVSNNYELKPVLQALFSSQHFYDSLNMGTMVKNPIDFVVGTARSTVTLATIAPTSLVGLPLYAQHFFHKALYEEATRMQMSLLDPPNVAGWKAYYQVPEFHELWVNAVTYDYRNDFITRFISGKFITDSLPLLGGNDLNNETTRRTIAIDPVEFIKYCSNGTPDDINKLIDGVIRTCYPRPLTQLQRKNLKNGLLGGIWDTEWPKEWQNFYLLSKTPLGDTTMTNRIVKLLSDVFNMAEYQLS